VTGVQTCALPISYALLNISRSKGLVDFSERYLHVAKFRKCMSNACLDNAKLSLHMPIRQRVSSIS